MKSSRTEQYLGLCPLDGSALVTLVCCAEAARTQGACKVHQISSGKLVERASAALTG